MEVEQQQQLQFASRSAPRRARPANRGYRARVHDLQEIFDELNPGYFEGRVKCSIIWGRNNPGLRRRSLRLGSYSPRTRTIRIHPALDQPWVPRVFVASVVHHEMCHASLHGTDGVRAGVRHDRRFRSMANAFEHRDHVRTWQKQNLKRLLSY